jgi:hypothetical protein
MTLNGRANWWLPAWLNRRLPRLMVEPDDEPVGELLLAEGVDPLL